MVPITDLDQAITFYGMTEFRVRDPDGNQVWIGAREAPDTSLNSGDRI
jgi:hypothetical protein